MKPALVASACLGLIGADAARGDDVTITVPSPALQALAPIDLDGVAILPREVTERPGGRTVRCDVLGRSEGAALLTEVDGVVAGAVWLPDQTIELLPAGFDEAGRALVRAREINAAALPACSAGEQVCGGAAEHHAPAARAGLAPPGEPVRVLVLLADRALARLGQPDALGAYAQALIDSTNLGYANSLVDARLELAGAFHIAYDEQSQTTDAGELMRWLTQRHDGVLDEVHDLRDATGADLVAVIVDLPFHCGFGWLDSDDDRRGFSLTDIDCALGNLTFAHEIGHNQGCDHDAANVIGPLFNHGRGWRWEGLVTRRSILAYTPGSRVPHFSNPDVLYEGQQTGITNVADNARVIDETQPSVAAYRTGTGDATDCNGDGEPDALQIALGEVEDRDENGVPDSCQPISEDCNFDDVDDALQLVRIVRLQTGPLRGVAPGSPVSAVFPDPAPALSDVSITIVAYADLGEPNESLEARVNGGFLAAYSGDGGDCSEVTPPETVVLSAAEFNAMLPGPLTFEFEAVGPVENFCFETPWVAAEIVYTAVDPAFDANGDGVIDGCECPGDVTGDLQTTLADFTALGLNFGATGLPHGDGESRSLGDLNDDGAVNLADFAVLGADFGCAA